MSETPLKSVLIIGDTLEGWLSAAFLAQQFKGTGLSVSLCAHPDQAQMHAPIVAATPSLAKLHSALKLDERDIIKFCRASFRLGTQFTNWHKGGKASYVHAYHNQTEAMDGVGFHHHWLRLQSAGKTDAFDNYSLSARMGRAGKFRHPMPDDTRLRASFSYGYHLDSALYTEFMRRCASHYGVHTLGSPVSDIHIDKTGISSVTLEDGSSFATDLYLDCTGVDGHVISLLDKTNWQDWGAQTPFMHIAWAHTTPKSPIGLAQIRSFSHGWTGTLPLQSGGARMCVYAQEGEDKLAALLGTDDIQTRKLNTGKRRAPWVGNCIAIGQSACNLEPLEGPDLCFHEASLSTLRALFPANKSDCGERAEYNRIMSETFARFRDFQIAHYRLVGHQGDVWDACADLACSEELSCKMEQFESRGRMVMYDYESFNAESWIALFLGQGLTPKRIDPLAQTMPMAKLESSLSHLRKAIDQAVGSMPDQLDYLASAGVITPPNNV